MLIPPADYAVPLSRGNRTRANHGPQKRQRKRRVGYQVEQTTSAARILTKHQQPPEQPLAPPIKRRRVHNGRRVVSSFKEQPTQEPMETESAITACTGSLPVAVFGLPPENPRPTCGNILFTISETTPTPVRGNIEPNIEPIEDDEPADIPSEVLSKFVPEHQEALREHLINDNLEVRQYLKKDLKKDLKIVVQSAEKLLNLLHERKIELSKNRSKPPFPNLFSRLKVYSITETPELFSTYFAKAFVFFSAVNTYQIKNTGCLTSMLYHKWQIKGFAGQSEEVIRFIATHPFLKQITSMRNTRGFPPKEEVATFMSIPCLKQGWQQGCDEAVHGKHIDHEMLIHISSMHNGRDFPGREQVEDFMTMPCLKEGWQQGRDGAVQEKPIDRNLLIRIASMNSCKGFPTRAQVAAFMTMPCLKEGWQPGRDEAVQGKQIDRTLLMRIASMNGGKGFPAKAQVEAFMAMPCLIKDWQGCDEAVQDNPLDRELLAHIACMNNGKGFPTEAQTRAFVRWLPRENKKHCLKIASRVFHSSGLPKQSVLTANERTLRRYLPDLPEYAIDSDSDNEPDHARAEDQQMKILALFCSAPKKWRLNFAEFEQYLTSFTNARNNDRSQVLCALASLLPMLFNHGGAGVHFWLARHNDNPQDRHLLTQALAIPAPLDTVTFALTQLPESECLAYIVLCAKLSPAPNKAQWDGLKPLREQLDQRFMMARSKTRMLEILWSQPEAKRLGYGENPDSFFDIMFDVVFEIVPTIRQLYRIHQAFGPQKMQGFLDACLAWQTANAEPLKVKAQALLMEGLLLAHHYLNDHGNIQDLCFSSQVASRNGKGVMINGDAAMPGNRRLWHFISAMLIELGQTPEYQFEKQQLTVLSGRLCGRLCGRLSDSESVTLPKPEFSLAGSGFVITNWSLEQLQTFFKATEFTERWYKRPQDQREPCVARLDERLARMRARASETEKNGNQKTANHKTLNHKITPPNVILSVIKSGLPLKPVVWMSLEHYAENGQLTDKLCRALAPVIEQQAAVASDK